MKICASSSEVVTQRPTPVRSRSNSAIMHAKRQQVARGQVVDRDADAHRPLARQSPVIDISPPMPWAI